MIKYILPVVNCVVLCSLCLLMNFRDGTPTLGLIFAAIPLVSTIYLINLIRKNGNEIKINALNKLMTLLSFVTIAGCLYETVTVSRISDETGDIIALLFGAVGVGIWLHDYYIKPFKSKKQ